MNVPVVSPLRHLDLPSIGDAARSETRSREVHLPPVSAYRWWARRTEAVNGAILDAISVDRPGRLTIADTFAGGGVIALAAAVRKHRVYAQDLNPWATFGLHGMLNLPQPGRLTAASKVLERSVQDVLGMAYATTLSSGEPAFVSHTFRVAVAPCENCGTTLHLFPHSIVSLKRRVERGGDEAFIACRCGHLFEGSRYKPSPCPACAEVVEPDASYTSRRVITCFACGFSNRLEDLAGAGNWTWQIVLVERVSGRTRELSLPTSCEVEQAEKGWSPHRMLPPIPYGRESAVLRRHGFTHWHDLYPVRQRVVMEALLDAVDAANFAPVVTEGLKLAALGVAEMAGFASRWDRWYLKSYESMASHRFNFTTFTAEPNVWGTTGSGRGTFTRRVVLLEKATKWLSERAGKLTVSARRAGKRRTPFPRTADVLVVEGSSEQLVLPSGSIDVVLTDPPYHDDVQYGELSLPLRAWAGLSTEELRQEAVALNGNGSAYIRYQELLERIFVEAKRALASDGHLIFSYANREPDAWAALMTAIDRAGYQGAGYTLVHSENESDHAKRNVRACTMDLILDLVPVQLRVAKWRPDVVPTTHEESFLCIVGDTLLDSVGKSADWTKRFKEQAEAHPFIVRSR
jgi:putative DNA methylase